MLNLLSLLSPILKKSKAILSSIPLMGKNPLGAPFILLLVILAWLLAQNHGLNKQILALRAKDSGEHSVTVTGAVQTVEKVIYRDGPTRTIEKVKYIKSDPVVEWRELWDREGFDYASLDKKKHWNLGYSYVGLASHSHGILLGRKLGSVTISAGPAYLQEEKKLGLQLGLSLDF